MDLMNNTLELLANDISHALGWTIIHSLWQCSLITLLVTTSYAFTKKVSAAKRYWINIFGLLSCIVASIITFVINLHNTVVIDIISRNVADDSFAIMQSSYIKSFHSNSMLEIFDKYIDKVVLLWIIGFSFYLIKYLTEFWYCQHIKNYKNKPLGERWITRFNELKNCLGITQSINLRISEIATIPCVIGHFKPMILLPVSMMLGLSHQQLDVILLHELAHIRRNDYFTKGLQTFITSIYFFNPFIHWLSSKIDEERENACDDIAVSVSGDPLLYANTLKEFAEMKENHTMIIAIAGSKKLLLNRIKRLFSYEVSFSKTYGKTITIMAFFFFVATYSLTGFSDNEKENKFDFEAEDMTLSEIILSASKSCKSEMRNVKPIHLDRKISIATKDITCEKLAEFITKADGKSNEKTFKVSFKNEYIDTILSKISDECPGITERVHLKNPSYIQMNFVSNDATCTTAQAHIEAQYLAATTVADESTIVNDGFGTAPYSEAVWPNMVAPTELKVNAEVNCNSLFSVDKMGKPFEVSSKCLSSNREAALAFERTLINAIYKTQFTPKSLNGKVFTMTNIHILNNFSIDEQKGIL